MLRLNHTVGNVSKLCRQMPSATILHSTVIILSVRWRPLWTNEFGSGRRFSKDFIVIVSFDRHDGGYDGRYDGWSIFTYIRRSWILPARTDKFWWFHVCILPITIYYQSVICNLLLAAQNNHELNGLSSMEGTKLAYEIAWTRSSWLISCRMSHLTALAAVRVSKSTCLYEYGGKNGGLSIR